MEFEELQQIWQRQENSSRVSIEKDILLKLVRRDHEALAATLLRRDFLEIAIALILVPIWIWLGQSNGLVWTWYLVIPGMLWIAGFLSMDRWKQGKKKINPGTTLRDSVQHALAQVEHQISLLRNVAWWYLLPITIPLLVFHIHNGWVYREPWDAASQTILVVLVMWGLYELNQYAVQKNLKPRRDELREFLDSLDDGDTPIPNQEDK